MHRLSLIYYDDDDDDDDDAVMLNVLRSMVQEFFTSTETRRLVRTDTVRTAQDGHLDSHTAPNSMIYYDRAIPLNHNL